MEQQPILQKEPSLSSKKKIRHIGWYFKVMKNYAVFKGRARRKEYWFFTLFSFILLFLMIFFWWFFTEFMQKGENVGLLYKHTVIPSLIHTLIHLVPNIAVTVRRLHDRSLDGAWYLLIFIPYIGGILTTILMMLDSKEGENKYGPNPKEMEMYSQVKHSMGDSTPALRKVLLKDISPIDLLVRALKVQSDACKITADAINISATISEITPSSRATEAARTSYIAAEGMMQFSVMWLDQAALVQSDPDQAIHMLEAHRVVQLERNAKADWQRAKGQIRIVKFEIAMAKLFRKPAQTAMLNEELHARKKCREAWSRAVDAWGRLRKAVQS